MSHRVHAHSLSQGYSAPLRSVCVFGFFPTCVCVCDFTGGESGTKILCVRLRKR